MPTGRQLISDVRSLDKLLSADSSITDRAIYRELRSTTNLLIKRETNLRRLWNTPNIFTLLKCMKMEAVPLSECCDYQSNIKVARSIKEIPQISEGIFGLLIQTVYSPGLTKFDYSAIDRFVNLLKLNIKNTKKYFWVYGNKLYVSNPDIENIEMSAYFDEDIRPEDYTDCVPKIETCINPLDRDFKIPSYLEKNIKDMVHETLMKTYFRHVEDKSPDANDTEITR
ncbi:MAG: hypothetical protein ABIW79_00920 [Gemmatimonas sp.]